VGAEALLVDRIRAHAQLLAKILRARAFEAGADDVAGAIGQPRDAIEETFDILSL
jgi:hypothetical protein